MKKNKVMSNCQFSIKLVQKLLAYRDYIADYCDHISSIYIPALLRWPLFINVVLLIIGTTMLQGIFFVILTMVAVARVLEMKSCGRVGGK